VFKNDVEAGISVVDITERTGFYEKVINVKADVAAVLVSATKRREW
jgi:hypothetical protein